MNPELPGDETLFASDMKTFEQLPVKTKELVVLKDAAEKTTGPESVKLHKKIRPAAAVEPRAPRKVRR
ncbi:MAG: hypothetical protein H7343_22250 [Undibacterium sp.]|nr:hypothetical protein [Opitutaceae bacterium]